MNPLRKWASIYIAAVGKGIGAVAGLPNADAIFRLATKIDPANDNAIMYQGAIQVLKNEDERAIEYFNEALERKIDWEHYAGRGTAYRRIGKYERALSDFNQALQLEPNSVGLRYARGITYYQMGDFDSAQTDLDWVLTKDPALGLAYYYRALVFHNKGDYQRANSDYRNAVRVEAGLPRKFYQTALQDIGKGTEWGRQQAMTMLRHILALSDDVQLRQESQALLEELEG
jgi:tetratricopeptide (TPR) repeat protein